MTLFETAAPDQAVFGRLLDANFGGQRDERTLALLRRVRRRLSAAPSPCP